MTRSHTLATSSSLLLISNILKKGYPTHNPSFCPCATSQRDTWVRARMGEDFPRTDDWFKLTNIHIHKIILLTKDNMKVCSVMWWNALYLKMVRPDFYIYFQFHWEWRWSSAAALCSRAQKSTNQLPSKDAKDNSMQYILWFSLGSNLHHIQGHYPYNINATSGYSK